MRVLVKDSGTTIFDNGPQEDEKITLVINTGPRDRCPDCGDRVDVGVECACFRATDEA